MDNATQIRIYTDGACRGNQSGTPNLGAWAYILLWGDKKKSNAQAVTTTTNNRMELQAAIEALSVLKPAAKLMSITLYSDSQYLVKGYMEWLPGWIAKNFAGVKNPDLWKQLYLLGRQFPGLRFQYVPGHSDVDWNNEADYLCNAAMDVYLQEHKEDKK